MLRVEEALEVIEREARAIPARSVSLAEAEGCVLAEAVSADLDSPPFDKSLVDGYALRWGDVTASGVRLRVVEEVLAGHSGRREVGPGEAVAITTGAPLPPGADAVVMHEKTQREGEYVVIEQDRVSQGQNRITRGRELRAGQVVLERGTRLNAARIGVLATVGRADVCVVPRPWVTIVPTGDELVEPGQVPGPGQIRNSNASMLQALVTRDGCDARCAPIARDEPEALRRLLYEGLREDVLLVSGGVSAGSRDLVPPALVELGVKVHFHKVRVKPGKPLLFGTGPDRLDGKPGCLVFGLPGNPVSTLVGYLLLARVAIRRAKGLPASVSSRPLLPLASAYQHRGERGTCHPSRLVDGGAGNHGLEPLDWAGSPDLLTVSRSDGFAIFEAGDRDYQAGDLVPFLSLAETL